MKLILTLPTLLLATGCGIVPKVQGTAFYGSLEPDGHFSASADSASLRSDIDALGVDDDDDVWGGRAEIEWGPTHLTVSGFDSKFAGSGTAEGQLDLGGTVITAGEDVDTKLDMTILNALLTFDFVPTDYLDIGLGFGAVGVDFDARIRSLTTGQTLRTDETWGLPVLAGRAEAEFGPFGIVFHANGLTGSYGGVDGTWYDFDVQGQFNFGNDRFYGGLIGGYRYMHLDGDYDDGPSKVDVDLDFSGPYVGLTIGI